MLTAVCRVHLSFCFRLFPVFTETNGILTYRHGTGFLHGFAKINFFTDGLAVYHSIRVTYGYIS